jgi:hypothetical protein
MNSQTTEGTGLPILIRRATGESGFTVTLAGNVIRIMVQRALFIGTAN